MSLLQDIRARVAEKLDQLRQRGVPIPIEVPPIPRVEECMYTCELVCEGGCELTRQYPWAPTCNDVCETALEMADEDIGCATACETVTCETTCEYGAEVY